jgi:hypothetical protein
MALVSILLAVVAFGCTVLGFLTTPIPVVGTVFSFGAAAVALFGIMLGGKATSVAKSRALPTDAARIAVILNVLAFVPALLVAFTCGVCNAIVSTGNVQVHKDLNFGFGPQGVPGQGADAGVGRQPAPESFGQAEGSVVDAAVAPANQAPNGLPPPPLPPGPRK